MLPQDHRRAVQILPGARLNQLTERDVISRWDRLDPRYGRHRHPLPVTLVELLGVRALRGIRRTLAQFLANAGITPSTPPLSYRSRTNE